jgi:hypothetical protein
MRRKRSERFFLPRSPTICRRVEEATGTARKSWVRTIGNYSLKNGVDIGVVWHVRPEREASALPQTSRKDLRASDPEREATMQTTLYNLARGFF